MSVQGKAHLDWREIIFGGAHEVLDDYAGRDDILSKFKTAFHEAVEELEGKEARAGVERDGLRNVHRHLPANKVALLEYLIKQKIGDDLYTWAQRVGKETIRLADPFYIDMLIVIRIHYPQVVAREGGKSIAAPTDWKERRRLLMASVRNPNLIINQITKPIRKRSKIAEHRIAYNAKAYHGDLPTLARSHGPHIDTWYGHSFDGFNVWLSIDGVNTDNTIILYPEMFGYKVDYDPKSMYLAEGVPIPKPTKVDLKPGQLLLFNPEMLHGTQVNISEETRVALTMRVNPKEPRFNDDAPFNAEHWYASTDIAKGRFSRISLFQANKYHGQASVSEKPVEADDGVIRLDAVNTAPRGEDVVLCDASALAGEDRLTVDVGSKRLLVVRTAEGIRAYDRRCPHQKVDIVDGARDGDELFCPGHGIAFSLTDGASKCAAFRLRSYPVEDRDGKLVLTSSMARAEDTVAAE
ncbi:MAG: Rieske 2Fe-2S domain-containing protein [Sphingobium sp.]